MAFIDLGDQFVALSAGRSQPPDTHRHLGLVVDDREAARRALEEAGAEILPGRGLDFLDPWGNHMQVVQYDECPEKRRAARKRPGDVRALCSDYPPRVMKTSCVCGLKWWNDLALNGLPRSSRSR